MSANVLLDSGSGSGSLSESQMAHIQQLLLKQSGIDTSDLCHATVKLRLRQLVRQRGLRSVTQLLARPGRAEETEIVDALLNHETSFFRDLRPFALLRDSILPALFTARPENRLRIWSAASSTGQEAYSVAMLLLDAFPEQVDRVSVMASDCSMGAIRDARAGLYRQLDVNRGMPARFLTRFFRQQGTCWRVAPELATRVVFDVVDLRHLPPALGRFDIILLRNVLLYFAEEERTRITRSVISHLEPGGWMIAGAGEQVPAIEGLERHHFDGTVAYRRSPAAPLPAEPLPAEPGGATKPVSTVDAAAQQGAAHGSTPFTYSPH